MPLQSAVNGGVSSIQNDWLDRAHCRGGGYSLQNQPQGSAIVPCRAEVALCLETKLRRSSASFSPAGGAARPLRQPRSLGRQRAFSHADSVATRCIYGQVVTTIRNGGLYEGRGTEEHGRGRCQRKVLTTIRDRDPPGRRIEFPQRCQLRRKLYRT
jgi:hypothetical protein